MSNLVSIVADFFQENGLVKTSENQGKGKTTILSAPREPIIIPLQSNLYSFVSVAVSNKYGLLFLYGLEESDSKKYEITGINSRRLSVNTRNQFDKVFTGKRLRENKIRLENPTYLSSYKDCFAAAIEAVEERDIEFEDLIFRRNKGMYIYNYALGRFYPNL